MDDLEVIPLLSTTDLVRQVSFSLGSNDIFVAGESGIYSLGSERHEPVYEEEQLWHPKDDRVLEISPDYKRIFGKRRSSIFKPSEKPFFLIDVPSRQRTDFDISSVNPNNVHSGNVFSDSASYLIVSDGYHIYKVTENGNRVDCLTKRFEGVQKEIGQRNNGSMNVDISADGKLIVFSTWHYLYVMNAEGCELRRLAEFRPGIIMGLKMTPDGKTVLVVCVGQKYTAQQTGIFSVRADGSSKILLTKELPYTDMDISSDNSSIVFEGGPISKRVIYMMNIDGTEKEQIFPSAINSANHGLESTGAPPAAETPETHP